jgi:hypothetical protein
LLDTTGLYLSINERPNGECAVCGGYSWKVQKTFRHHGRTLFHGPVGIRETIYACANDCHHPSGHRVTKRADAVTSHLLPDGSIGYDLLVFVGCQRFLEHRQREEIREMLKAPPHGIHLSSGEISLLTKRFVHYLARLHYARAGSLKAALERDGGWPMHIDATGEDGRGTLFAVMAGWRPWVLSARKLATERAELILPCLRDTADRFGTPCAAMRDLGQAVIQALKDFVAGLIRPIRVLGCHQHFLADVGSDLLKSSYGRLRELFRQAKIRPKLRSLTREIGRIIGTEAKGAREAVIRWQTVEEGHRIEPGKNGMAIVRAMAQWTLDYPADATGLDFPFDRPYLDLYNRCRVILRSLDAFLRIAPDDPDVAGVLKRMHRMLAPVDRECPFRETSLRLDRRARLFDELRDTLRHTGEISTENLTQEDLDTMHGQLDRFVAAIKERRPKRGPASDMREAIDCILKHITKHGKSLWGHAIRLPESAGGGIRVMDRTNNRIENRFKGLKHGERRRSGRKNLTQDLEHLPAEALFVENLKCPDYVQIVCGSLDKLPQAFAQLDREEREMRWKGVSPKDAQEDTPADNEVSSASLSTEDKRVVRTEAMNRRIRMAAASRAPRRRICASSH